MQPTNRNIIFMSQAIETFASWLLDNYDNWVKLNDVLSSGDLPNLLASGGADDTLLSGSVVQVDGDNWVDGYANIGITSLAINDKTYINNLIFNDFSGGTYYRIYIDASNLIQIYISGGGSVVAYYRGGAVDEFIVIGSLIPNKKYVWIWSIPSAGSNGIFYINGLMDGIVNLANDIVGTSIIDSSSALGALTTVGGSPVLSYMGELQINNAVLSYYDIRTISLRSMGYTNPLGFHNAYQLLFDGTASEANYGTPTDLNNILAGGASFLVWCTPYSRGGSNIGMFLTKRSGSVGWEFNVFNQTGNNVGMRFISRHATTNGVWATDSEMIPLNELSMVGMSYNGDVPASNDPVFYHNGAAVASSTTSYPTAINDDSAVAFRQGGQSASYVFDGTMPMAIVVNRVLTAGEMAEFYNGGVPKDPNSLSFASDIVMASLGGDFIDATNIDNILTTGTGTIYDASGNGNDATPTNMDHANLIETRPTDYTSYQSAMQSALNPTVYLVGYGNSYIDKANNDTFLASTNTARDGEDYLGNAQIAYDGATSYTATSGLITGSVPTKLVFGISAEVTNWNLGSLQYLIRLNVGGDAIRLYASSGTLTLNTDIGTNNVTLTADCSGYVGIKQIFVVVSNTAIYLYVDGQLADSDTLSEVLSGTAASFLLGGANVTPLSPLDGNILEVIYIANNDLAADQISDTFDLRARN
jgi:hypothetical protein